MTLKSISAAIAIATAGFMVPVSSAHAAYIAHYGWGDPSVIGGACPNYNSTTHLPYWGGTIYCRYGFLDYHFPDYGNDQVFVIGTDFSVWTRWWEWAGFWSPGKQDLSPWVNLGGQVIHAEPSDYSFDTYKFFGTDCSDGLTLTIWVTGTDGQYWYDQRSANGHWSGWVKRNRAPACPSASVAALSASLDPEDAAFVQEDAALDPPELVSDPPELVSDVPEPSSSWMILTALVGLIGYRWRVWLFPHSA